MRSFVEMNGACLKDFFTEAMRARRASCAGPDGMDKWAADGEAHSSLINSFSPILSTSNDVVRGIHASAYLFNGCVVKTNVFGGFAYDGQRMWLEWCAAHQDNPLAPKIEMLLVDPDTDRFLVVMERLVRHSGFKIHSFREEIDTALRESFEVGGRHKSFMKAMEAVRVNSKLAIAELESDMDYVVNELNDHECAAELRTSIENHHHALKYVDELVALWRTLTTTGAKHFAAVQDNWRACVDRGHIIDMHGVNWMLRGNGDQVLLDPVN